MLCLIRIVMQLCALSNLFGIRVHHSLESLVLEKLIDNQRAVTFGHNFQKYGTIYW